MEAEQLEVGGQYLYRNGSANIHLRYVGEDETYLGVVYLFKCGDKRYALFTDDLRRISK